MKQTTFVKEISIKVRYFVITFNNLLNLSQKHKKFHLSVEKVLFKAFCIFLSLFSLNLFSQKALSHILSISCFFFAISALCVILFFSCLSQFANFVRFSSVLLQASKNYKNKQWHQSVSRILNFFD